MSDADDVITDWDSPALDGDETEMTDITEPREVYRTYESRQPWIVYTYPVRDDEIPVEGGISRVEMLCAICGAKEDCHLVVPAIGREPVMQPGYYHHDRIRFLGEHVHRHQQTAPETWALPLLNPAAHGDTMDILRDVAERAKRKAQP